jgi:hypothetical protein
MAGTIIPLFTKRAFEVLGTSKTTLVRTVDVSRYTEGVLQVRVHANTIGSGSLDILAFPIANTSEDPATDFVGTTAVATANIALPASFPAGTLVRASLAPGFGGAVQIRVSGNTPTLSVTLSADLVMKE